MALETILKTVMDELKQIAQTETIVGKEIRTGDTVIIPVSKISIGIAGGGASGKNDKEGAGIGGGATIEPIAFIVVTNGRAQLLPMNEKTGALSKVIDLIPDVLEKVAGSTVFKARNNEKSESE